jgi:hypothetical protein
VCFGSEQRGGRLVGHFVSAFARLYRGELAVAGFDCRRVVSREFSFGWWLVPFLFAGRCVYLCLLMSAEESVSPLEPAMPLADRRLICISEEF